MFLQMLRAPLFLATLGLLACSESSDDGAPDAALPLICTCPSAEGCVRVHVTRAADDTNMPWKVWPAEADGKGTLVSALVAGTNVKVRKTNDNANFVSQTAASTLDLGCVAAGDYELHTFLDDNGNAAADAYFSGDYHDSCLGNPRALPVTVVEGLGKTVEATLKNSCD